MRASLSVLVATGLVALAGCGAGTTSIGNPAPTYLNLNGNWEAIGGGGSIINSTPISAFTGALQSTSGNVTGTLRAISLSLPMPCVSPTQDLTATGTLTGNGDLTLTVPISGGTATLAAGLSANLEFPARGSWTIVGGTCAMAATPIAIEQYPSVAGTYSGTLSVGGVTSSVVTAVLVQSSTPNADGEFPLSGTVSFAGPGIGACAGTYPLTSGEVVTGNLIGVSGNASQVSSAQLNGVISPDAGSIFASTAVISIVCPVGSFAGTLARQ